MKHETPRSAKVVQVIETISIRGEGTEADYYTNADDRNVDDQVNGFWGLAR